MALQYSISVQNDKFFIHIGERGSRRILYWDTLSTLAKDKDREVLLFLKKIHTRFSRSLDTLSFQQIECQPKEIFEAMRLLSQTESVVYLGKSLQCDWKVFAKIYWQQEEQSVFSAYLQYKEEIFSLSSCEKLFYGWCILGAKAFPIQSSVPWQWVELFSKGSISLEGNQKKRFLDASPLILQSSFETSPCLLITDARGCFANLSSHRPDWERDLLDVGYVCKVVENSSYFCPSDQVRDALALLLDVGWNIMLANGKRLHRSTRVQWNMSEKQEFFVLQGEALFQEKKASLCSIAQAVQKGRLWVEIDQHSAGLIDQKAEISLEGEWIAESLHIRRHHIALLAPFMDAPHVAWEPKLLQAMRDMFLEQDRECALPSSLFQGQLLAHQQKGVDWLNLLYKWGFSGLLADEMGLGKTVQVLAFFSRLKTNLPILIVTPSSLTIQWQREIERFLPSAQVCVYIGANRAIDVSSMQNLQYVIVSYTLLRLDVGLFSKVQWEVIVLDESNAIKTASTQTAQAACMLQGRFRIALNGTPIENRLEELASQFQFLMPHWIQHVEVEQKKCKPFILRRKKDELDLPEKLEQLVWVAMDEEQSQVYHSYHEGVRTGLLKKIDIDGASAHRIEILEAILRFRQIAADPRLMGSQVRGAKIERLLLDIEEAVEDKRKVLIYSQFTSMLALIGKELKHSFLYLDGAVPSEERAKRVQMFQEDPNALLFLLSLKAGGVGLNLCAADYVFLFDPWWNDAVEDQAISRSHRLGRKTTVIAKRYLTPSTIEEKMLRLKEEKRKAAGKFLDDGEEPTWTAEDWIHLLS